MNTITLPNLNSALDKHWLTGWMSLNCLQPFHFPPTAWAKPEDFVCFLKRALGCGMGRQWKGLVVWCLHWPKVWGVEFRRSKPPPLRSSREDNGRSGPQTVWCGPKRVQRGFRMAAIAELLQPPAPQLGPTATGYDVGNNRADLSFF